MIALIADFFLRWSFWGGMGRRRGSSSGGDQAGAILAIVAIVLAILAPLAAYAVQFAVSRRREYLADASAVELTRNPLGLARALTRIASDPAPLRHANRATAHLYIANPLKKTKRGHRRLRHAPAHPAAHRRPSGDGPRRAGRAGGGGGGPGRPGPAGAGSSRAARLRSLSRRRRGAAGRSRSEGAGRGPAAGVPAPLPRAPWPSGSGRARSARSRSPARRRRRRRTARPPARSGRRELRPPERLPDRVAPGLQAKRPRQIHGGLRGVPVLEEVDPAPEQRVGLALGAEIGGGTVGRLHAQVPQRPSSGAMACIASRPRAKNSSSSMPSSTQRAMDSRWTPRAKAPSR